MRITELRLGTLSIPLKKPFKTALRSTDTVTTNIVALVSERGPSATARRLLRRPLPAIPTGPYLILLWN